MLVTGRVATVSACLAAAFLSVGAGTQRLHDGQQVHEPNAPHGTSRTHPGRVERTLVQGSAPRSKAVATPVHTTAWTGSERGLFVFKGKHVLMGF